MAQVDLTVRVGGDSAAGGIVTTGEIVARIAAFSGLEIYTTRTIPAEIKGGHVMFQLRASDAPVYSQGDDLDMLIAFDQESIDNYYHLIKPDGFLIFNGNDGKPPAPNGVNQYGLPLNDLAKQINFSRGRNIITIGAMVKLFDLPLDKATEVVRRQLGRKKELLEQNLLALKTGYDYIEQHISAESPYHLIPESGGVQEERLVMSGNQALAIGAIAGGCRFYAGYPITPASDIMEFLASEFPQIQGTMIQAEDEIAAINMCLGASFTGARAMTATSGPGVSLMVEALGHATMTEIPIVVVDVQRAGPSTGMPTKVSQGDLRLAIFGAHDDAPRIVVAPVSVEDCFYQIVNAFNLAEKYQTPVIFLSDQDMSVRVVTIPPFDTSRIKLEPRLIWEPGTLNHGGNGASGGNGLGAGASAEYLRYRVTDSGISPMSLPGMPGGQYTAEGLEKSESGAPIYTAEAHTRNFEKRARKLANALEDYSAWEMFETFGAPDAPVAVVGWGSTIGPVREAVMRAESEGMPVAVLYPKLLYPLPVEHIGEFIKDREQIIVPELNFTGQFGRMLQAQYGREMVHLTSYGGVPLAAREMYNKIKQVYSTLKVKVTVMLIEPQTIPLHFEPVELKPNDYKSTVKPIWCPGCGDFGVLSSFYKAISEMGIPPEQLVIASGIGCSGRFPAFCKAYGFHGVHGRVLPLATGIKMARPELVVCAVGGDGDAFSIGMGHFPHAARRNVDISYIVMDNEIYGLTKGQASPTSPLGLEKKSTPYGNVDRPLNPIMLALASGATWVARGFSSKPKEMTDLIKQAISHKGFSFLQIYSPCVTFYDTYDHFKQVTKPLPEGHNASDKSAAMNFALDTETLYLGVYYKEERPTYDDAYSGIRQKATRGEYSLENVMSKYKR